MIEPMLQANMQKYHPKFEYSICIQYVMNWVLRLAPVEASDILYKSGVFIFVI